MRDIIFRGKVIDEPNEWVYGYLLPHNRIHQEKEHIDSKCCGLGTFTIIPESVGEYTGQLDMTGKKIFEHDIVKDEITNKYYKVIYMKSNFCLGDAGCGYGGLLYPACVSLRVVGNTVEVNE